ncbi:hypothetical protein HSBAA_61310 [Vreelandella sulfidaeris]|uniref:Uncharacterized protein n=1 Tax=Vreelandella sulfidaeris TaxID=115553 RepID=A0A455UFE0_9GAMM|nr:hypothetical protein HSBAA_61310 [Halomonas sulfidaeris]
MSITSEKQLPEAVAAWRDPEMDSVKGTETPRIQTRVISPFLAGALMRSRLHKSLTVAMSLLLQNGQKISALPTTYLYILGFYPLE